ncbi:PREDICTED: uncharacterized protein LOC107187148 [Dufourea novaeangliae]|uniref:uncharacterized protein LOC107187148 n=1 Tax=Dufourea novaeangliae TaxID=178035 RepID=UPI00076792B9|nr:PREDICTED: uncharacterized protein LOC107187148 [Dufourea novaeangliae]
MISMDAIWNHMQLERPPNATCCIQRAKFDATGFLTVLEKVLKDLHSQELLHKDAAILSRLIYRMKSKFRNDKGVKAMSKVNRGLLNYLSLSLEKEYENLRNYVEIDNNYIKLPSKQMVEYVLVRTQGFAKLMLRIEEVSKHAAHFLRSRIALGHAWSVATIAFSVVSRIWILSRHLIKRSCTWYNDLYQYLKLFKLSGLNWLPSGFELPTDLRVWLAVPWIDEPIPNVPSSHGLKNTMFKLIVPRQYDLDEELACDNSTEVKCETVSPYSQKKSIVHEKIVKDEQNVGTDNDIGEILDRHSFKLKQYKQERNMPIEEKHESIIEMEEINDRNAEDHGMSIKRENYGIKPNRLYKKKDSQKVLTLDNVKSKSDLINLLNKESYPGLEKLQWNIMRNKGKKLLNKLDASNETNRSNSYKKVIKSMHRWMI